MAGDRLLYAGQDAAACQTLLTALGTHFTHVPLGESVNRHAEVLRDDFINLDKHLDQPVEDRLWQASDMAERNPFTSTLFQDACLYLACEEVLDVPFGRLLVVVENPSLGQALFQLAKRKGWRSSWRTGSTLCDAFPWLIRFKKRWTCLREALRCRLDLLKDLRRRKAVLARLGISRPKAGPQAFDTLLTVWAVTDTFPASRPKTHDPYWGELPEYLAREGQRVLSLATPAAWVEPFEDIAASIAASPEAVVLPEQCQSLPRAAWDALRTLFWTAKLRTPVILAGKDLTQLIRDGVWHERAKSRQMVALGYERVGPALKAWGMVPRQALHLYENQPWEKCLRRGFRDALPQTSLAACQHVPFSRLYLSFIPSRRELDAGLTPHRLIVPGEFWREVYLQAGYAPDQIVVAPSLRFSYLFSSACSGSHEFAGASKVNIVPQTPDSPPQGGMVPPAQSESRKSGAMPLTMLVAGGMDPMELRELLLARLIPASRVLLGLDVLLKFHPKMEPSAVAAILADLKQVPGFGFTLTTHAIADLLPQVDAVLYTSSGVCYEALAHGKHALYVGSDMRLDINKLDWFPDLHRKTRSPQELSRAIEEILNESPEAAHTRKAQAAELIIRLFACSNTSSLHVFLGNSKCDNNLTNLAEWTTKSFGN
ncbi:MAG: hypothetical protein FD177_2128 [Desulfovibrionaceae bacterium]|nr:MAG: hypothetical protein FD177_2128 [Desulfovibrionaceae bacterium]